MIPREILDGAVRLPRSRGQGMSARKSAEAVVGGNAEGPNSNLSVERTTLPNSATVAVKVEREWPDRSRE